MNNFFDRILKVCLLLLFVILLSNSLHASDEPLKINIFSEANGKGLQRDRDILLNALTDLKCALEWFEIKDTMDIPCADINIFIQEINPNYLEVAKFNWFIPNPEWYLHDISLLNSIDLVLCRTKEVERIFNNLNCKTYFLGFTSKDCFRKDIKKKAFKYLHVAGSSAYKGTQAIQNAWVNHPEFPYLTILKQHKNLKKIKNLKWIPHFVNDEYLVVLQNESIVHLCLSATEGFGHYIMEAMSTGALVITTNAPPMNEFILEPLCLVPFKDMENKKLATLYHVDAKDVEEAIQAVQTLSKEELFSIGNKNRERYLKLKEEFLQNLKHLIESVCTEISCKN